MSTSNGQNGETGAAAGDGSVDLKLEVVVIPVADADRSKSFYAGLGWRLDADFSFENGFRVVQFTPPGSLCSLQFGTNVTAAAPGSAHGLYLIVPDIEAGREQLLERGAKVSEVFHAGEPGAQLRPDGTNDRVNGPDPDGKSYSSFATFEDPDGNGWLLQENHGPVTWTGRPRRHVFQLRGRLVGRVTACRGSSWRAREAHRQGRPGLARLVRRVHGGRASRHRASVVSDYDVIVFGGGAPGEHCAAALAARGQHVAVVERELVGGECSYWACIPSKSLLRPGEAVQGARDVGAHAEVDVQAAFAWRDYMVSNYSDAGQERWLSDRGIDLLRGNGRLAGVGVVEVDGVRHTAEHVVVATGSEPIVPPVPGLRELDGVWGTREATSMKEVPRRLLVLGGGAAGVELAQVVRRLGGEAVVVEGADRLLPREPAPLGEALGEALRRDGIELVLNRRANSARRDGDDFVLGFEDGSEVRGDRLLVSTGRRPRVEGIGLETVGITANPKGIPVDDHLVAGERLWAIGDVNGIWPLTHVGEYEGDIVAANIAGDPRPANYEAVPRVTYTDPQAAAVGAADAPYSATALVSEVPKTATYTHAYAESNGFLTLLSDGTRLTGAYALGPEAGEWMQQATLAIRAQVPLEVLLDTIQPFPSFSGIYDSALKQLSMSVADMPLPAKPMDAQMSSLRP